MKKFEITKDTFYGKIAVLYDNNGSIFSISFEDADIADELKKSYKYFIPVRIENVPQFAKEAGCIIKEVSIAIHFEKWWNFYNLKRNKDAAEKLYAKINAEEHTAIWFGTKKYLRYCQRTLGWYNQMYPDTFLRNGHWKDDWDTIKH